MRDHVFPPANHANPQRVLPEISPGLARRNPFTFANDLLREQGHVYGWGCSPGAWTIGITLQNKAQTQ